MLEAARALAREKNPNLGTGADEIVGEFRKHFYDTKLFFDPFAGGKFAHYLFRAHEEHDKAATAEAAHQLIEEATLFVDAAHQCYTRLGSSLGARHRSASASARPEKRHGTRRSCSSRSTPIARPASRPRRSSRSFTAGSRNKLLPELMIDVANYAHVPKGPGVVLIGHGNDYFIDEGEGRLGLLYNRKRGAPEPGQRLADAFRRTLHAASLLESDATLAAGGAKLRFRTDELLLRINDRLGAPNDDETFAAIKPELDGFCRELFGAPATSRAPATPRRSSP